jgi:medium-chain acyl-[acyl-carrier-protein] hydrolase
LSIFSESYKVTSYLVNLRGQAGLYSMLNFVQDVGWMHAKALNVTLPAHHGWVFTRQKLLMNQWPSWNQVLTVKTWLREPNGAFVYRDYEFFIDGQKIGECTSTFAVIDMKTRQLAQQDWSIFKEICLTSDYLEHHPEKIPWNVQASEIAQFQVRNSDIDLNQHVNNTKYAQWILDSLPIEILKDGVNLKGYEVNFLAESKIGDMISLQQVSSTDSQNDVEIVQFQGAIVGSNKPAFTARMHTSKDELLLK